MSQLHRITTNPEQCGSRPCIRGLRIRVEDVQGLLAAGASLNELPEDYPYLEPEDVKSVLEFAGNNLNAP